MIVNVNVNVNLPMIFGCKVSLDVGFGGFCEG